MACNCNKKCDCDKDSGLGGLVALIVFFGALVYYGAQSAWQYVSAFFMDQPFAAIALVVFVVGIIFRIKSKR